MASGHSIALLWPLALLLACACAALADGKGATDTSQSPHVTQRTVGLRDVQWREGFWGEKLELCKTEIIPAVERGLLDPQNSEQLANLLVAAGVEEGEHRGTDWSDGECYKWLESLALMYAATGDPALDQKLDYWIDVIAKAQTPQGYISTNIGDNPGDFLQMPYRHEMYNMGHLLHAACIHHRATGKDSFLAVARKLADYLYQEFQPRPDRLVHFPWNPSAYMGLAEMYRTTRDERYLELLGIMIGNRGSSPGGGDHRNGGTDQTQDRIPIREETEAVGHAVCATYLYSGAADLYAETGDAKLLAGLERIWLSATRRRMYITGGVGTGGGVSTRGDQVHEAFLADYELPSREAYSETCSNIGNAMWNYRMLTLTGDARYGDVMERVLYNSALSAVSVDGKGFFYCNPLKWTGEESGPHGHHESTRWDIYDCYCCPPQVARIIATINTWAYGVSDDAVWVNLYGASDLETQLPGGAALGLTQETNYPWDGRVAITVRTAPDGPLAIKLRIPGWAEGAEVAVNGQPLDGLITAGSYLETRGRWSPGDVIELNLPMEPKLMEAHPLVKELNAQVAVQRGPVVYCLELPRAQDGERIWREGVFLPENVTLTPSHEPELLGGVTVLKGQALTFAGRDGFIASLPGIEAPPTHDWGPELYRVFTPRAVAPPVGGTIDITLIPYFAWANRGVSFMEIWIPLAR